MLQILSTWECHLTGPRKRTSSAPLEHHPPEIRFAPTQLALCKVFKQTWAFHGPRAVPVQHAAVASGGTAAMETRWWEWGSGGGGGRTVTGGRAAMAGVDGGPPQQSQFLM